LSKNPLDFPGKMGEKLGARTNLVINYFEV
jgi:hypothetical protein